MPAKQKPAGQNHWLEEVLPTSNTLNGIDQLAFEHFFFSFLLLHQDWADMAHKKAHIHIKADIAFLCGRQREGGCAFDLSAGLDDIVARRLIYIINALRNGFADLDIIQHHVRLDSGANDGGSIKINTTHVRLQRRNGLLGIGKNA